MTHRQVNIAKLLRGQAQTPVEVGPALLTARRPRILDSGPTDPNLMSNPAPANAAVTVRPLRLLVSVEDTDHPRYADQQGLRKGAVPSTGKE